MILIETGEEQVPNVHTAPNTLVCVACENYEFKNHVFYDGSVTTIACGSSTEFVYLDSCEVHAGATIVITGKRLVSGPSYTRDQIYVVT